VDKKFQGETAFRSSRCQAFVFMKSITRTQAQTTPGNICTWRLSLFMKLYAAEDLDILVFQGTSMCGEGSLATHISDEVASIDRDSSARVFFE
jgi:hypothetical protein